MKLDQAGGIFVRKNLSHSTDCKIGKNNFFNDIHISLHMTVSAYVLLLLNYIARYLLQCIVN